MSVRLDVRNALIVAQVETGRSLQEVGEDFSISRQRVEQIVKRDRDRARGLITKLVGSGHLERAELCALCGGSGELEAHHPDYAKPRVVTWLCQQCHIVADILRRRQTGERRRYQPRRRGLVAAMKYPDTRANACRG